MGKLLGYSMLSLLAILSLPTTLAITCYNPPTTPGGQGSVQDGNYTSCNVNQNVSMCCRSSTVNGYPPDACLSNGLCVDTTASAPTYWRESCTDPTWTSPYCVNALVSCSHDASNNAEVSQCPDDNTKYCCGNSNTACCGTSSEIYIPVLDQPSSTISAAPTATVTHTATSTPSSNPSSQGLSTGAKAGIGVLAAVAALLAALSFVLFMMMRRMKRNARAETHGATNTMLEEETGRNNNVVKVEPELHNYSTRPELHSSSVPWELPGESVGHVDEPHDGIGR
ncbi:uncharacterized protein PAC_15418 [Phialocephala subalpina]|uniref:Uncharacterized protein n=1 Tax=Phialocephala subalpina TaxID=576137 RepID=A0A1L7XKH2_9HELO|nr:uncharacterized protein PAC_15418 [Phialocephala subalpina]